MENIYSSLKLMLTLRRLLRGFAGSLFKLGCHTSKLALQFLYLLLLIIEATGCHGWLGFRGFFLDKISDLLVQVV